MREEQWDRLNKRLDYALDTMTDADWVKWYSNRETERKARRKKLVAMAKIRASELSIKETV